MILKAVMLNRLYFKNKKAYALIIFSCGLLLFSNYNIFATPDDWALNFDWSFIINNNDKMFYGLGDDLSNIQMQSDRLVLTHISGAWGLQYQGGNSTINGFAIAGNDFITTFNNNATIATISNNTVYWPADAFNPKYVNVTTTTEQQILAANFKEDLAAFQAANPPAVFIDLTESQVIVKSNHTVAETQIEISFQENVETGIPSLGGIGILIIALSLFFFVLIFLLRRKKK